MKYLLFLVALFGIFPAKAQELFIHAEPASNIPKSVIGIRIAGNHFNEFDADRYWTGLSVMYGISPKLMAMLSASASNHHDSKLPSELFSSDGSNGQVHSHNTIRGREYDMKFEGFYLYSKYRIFTIDGPKRHLRMAIYGEASAVQTPHDEAEPDLHGDNSGFGGGIIMTQLINKLAYSTTIGYIKPLPYNDKSNNSEFTSGESWFWSFS
ncbi:MAG TPA: hypothetical protein PKD91_09360, partial [Bacteroidia bacterium]|nr:hypothetical protein [Bacteroidia bacterium]